jgi:hypothetical protein
MATDRRIMHPLQQAGHLSWSDTLFEIVDSVPPLPMPEPIPVGEATDSDFGEFVEVMQASVK